MTCLTLDKWLDLVKPHRSLSKNVSRYRVTLCNRVQISTVLKNGRLVIQGFVLVSFLSNLQFFLMNVKKGGMMLAHLWCSSMGGSHFIPC